MRRLAWLVVLSACTNDGASNDGAPIAATDIQYDNTGTGLVSTNVQDALDDVASMAASHDERLSHSIIVCKFATNDLQLAAGGVVPHVFSALECGGKLPDASYTGALSKISTCSSSLQAIEIMNAGEPDGPGFVLRKSGDNTTLCGGPAQLVALFFKTN